MGARLELAAPPVADGGRVWVGFSGGCDSTVLLHRLAGAGIPGLRAVHVHHGLQPAADSWVRHCRRTCRALGVPLRVLHVEVVPAGTGLEAAARSARYAALAGLLRRGDVLATAHHRDDQAETVLYRALRGTGIAGLGAMRACEPLAAGLLWRPLLDAPRHELLAYASAHGLRWIDDPHNADRRLARAFLRHEVLPALDRHFPAAAASLARLARHAQASERLLATLAREDAATLCEQGGFEVDGLQRLEGDRRRNLLVHVWRDLGVPPPAESWYAQLERSVLAARADATPVLAHGGIEARRYRNRLYLMPALPPPPAATLRLRWLPGQPVLELPPGCGRLIRRDAGAGALVVRFGQAGASLRPVPGAQRRSLKNLCQEAGLPPWLRERMPLIELEAELIAVADRWQTARAAALRLQLSWVHALPGAPA